jgi:phosphoglycerate kinase
MTQKLSIRDLDVAGKRVLMRVDFNVPMNEKGAITDDTRIAAALPSIRYVLEHGGSLILLSHLGRPKEKKAAEFSLLPCAKRLSELLHRKVVMAPDSIGPEVEKLAKELKPGDILLLENLRFYRGEEHPEEEPDFTKKLAGLGDCYVNDAFGTAHRAHASTTTIAGYFPGKAAAGFLLEKEINYLGSTLLSPKRPFYALVGGAKISSKIGVVKALIPKIDGLIIGGGMAYTFLKAMGKEIGDSIHEEECIEVCKKILAECKDKGIRCLLPEDIVVVKEFSNDAEPQVASVEKGVPNGYQGVDIGPKTIAAFMEELKKAQTIFWNGPLGVCEFSNFSKGTKEIAKALSELHAVIIVGGGDSIAALQMLGLADKMTHISTGGGASLEYIEFGTLPGVEALSNK